MVDRIGALVAVGPFTLLVTATLGAQMSWTQATTGGPTVAGLNVMAFDATRQEVVMFGGQDRTGTFWSGDTWRWDGTAWTHATANGPSPRGGHDNFVYDPSRQESVLFGGWDLFQEFADTWIWDGAGWTPVATAGPPARKWHAMAWHGGRGRVVLFGGAVSGVSQGDTWEWDGATRTWTRLRLAGPSARHGHAMAYDRARDVVVLFGGHDGGFQRLGDTWELDRSSWTQVATTGPSPRMFFGMAWDAVRERVVLTGGFDRSGYPAETWEWDGVAWRQPLSSGPDASGHAMAYDPARQEVVLFPWQSATWIYRPTVRGATTQFGVGCPGRVGVPTIAALGPPIVGNRRFAVEVGSVPQNASVFLGLGIQLNAVQIPPCTVYTPFLDVRNGTAVQGAARIPLSIPWISPLSGADLFVQGGALDPGGSLLGALSLTPGLQVRIGD